MPGPVTGIGYQDERVAVIDKASDLTDETISSARITEGLRKLTYEDVVSAGREFTKIFGIYPLAGIVVHWKNKFDDPRNSTASPNMVEMDSAPNRATEEKDPRKVEKDPAPNKATEEKDPRKVEKDPAPNKATEEKDPQKAEKDPSPENSVEKDPAPKKDSYTPEIEKGEKDPNSTDEEPGRFS